MFIVFRAARPVQSSGALLLSVLRFSILLSCSSNADAMRTSRSHILQQRAQDSLTQNLAGRQIGNYILKEQYKNYKARQKPLASSFLEDGSNRTEAIPPDDFNHAKYKMTHYLRAGSYGVAYLASPIGRPEHRVVVKLVYTYKKDVMYIATGSQKDEPQFGEAIRMLARECDDLQKIQRGQAADLIGASRIVTCIDMCVSPKYGDGDCDTPEDSAQFIVMEYAGTNGEDWLRANNKDKHSVAQVLRHIAEGLNYLTNLDPPVIHHDLKWDNVAIATTIDGKPAARLIDFGASIEVLGRKSAAEVASTPGAAPPEWWEGYAYYNAQTDYYAGQAHAFDAYSFGTMALEGLCDMPWFFISEMKNIERKLFRIAKDHPEKELDLGGLGLQNVQGAKKKNLKCRLSAQALVHPDPKKRRKPFDVGFTFNECDFDKSETCIEITERDGTPVKQPSSRDPDSVGDVSQVGFLKRLEELVDNSPKKADTWQDLGVAWGWRETVASCVEKLWRTESKHKYFKDYKFRTAMKRVDVATSDAKRYAIISADNFPFCLMLRQVAAPNGLKPLSNAEDRKFSACALNHASSKVITEGAVSKVIGDAVARQQVALLQWGQIWNERETPVPGKTAKGSQFAFGLLYGPMTSTNFVKWNFQTPLDKVIKLAEELFTFAGKAAVPSMASHVHTHLWTRNKADKKQRKLYRHLYYLFNARLQAVAVRTACVAKHVMAGEGMLKRLHQLGHTHVGNIRSLTTRCPLPVDPKDALNNFPRVLDSASQIQKIFINPSSRSAKIGKTELPALKDFDDTTGDDSFDKIPEYYQARPSDADAFEDQLRHTCPQVIDPAVYNEGMYAQFRDYVAEFIMSGLINGIFNVLEKRDEEAYIGRVSILGTNLSSGYTAGHRKNFVLAAPMKDLFRKAGLFLADYVHRKRLAKSGYDNAEENAAKLEAAVLRKFYDDSNDDDYDDLGKLINDSLEGSAKAQQPGGIFYLKQLLAAVLDVVVHPSQEDMAEAIRFVHLSEGKVARAASYHRPPTLPKAPALKGVPSDSDEWDLRPRAGGSQRFEGGGSQAGEDSDVETNYKASDSSERSFGQSLFNGIFSWT